MLAVIGGSSLYAVEGLDADDSRLCETPYGDPSGPVVTGALDGGRMLFLSRHGEGHVHAPHLINYRANMAALKAAGARRILAVCTAGGIREDCTAGTVVVPDQIIDYTWGRSHTLVEDGAPLVHVDFTDPFPDDWRSRVLGALKETGARTVDGGTCAVSQGPRLETAAEVRRLAVEGCDLVNMTMMPEAVLAREMGLEYAAVCPIANRAAGLDPGRLDVAGMAAVLKEPIAFVMASIARLL